MFTADVKILRTLKSPSDVQCLLNNIHRLSTWSQTALVRFKTDKCVVLRPHPQQAEDSNPQYQLNGERLRCLISRKRVVEETLKPNCQSPKAAKNANSIMRAIKASFMNITPTRFDNLYGTFMRPHLEYSFQAWRPWLKKNIKLLEDDHRCSTKLVKGLQDIEFEERAPLLNLDSLSWRMDKGDMILVYKIFHGFLEGVQWRDFFQMADTSRLRGHS